MIAPDGVDCNDGPAGKEEELPFFGYPKIADSGGWAKIPKTTKPWIVLEKIHGSCFTIATNGSTVKTAKRREWLQEGDESYHDTGALLARLKKSVLLMHEVLCGGLKPDGTRHVLYVFGELYGGEGDDAVQSEIFYCPEVSFRCFDAAVDGVFVDYCNVVDACDKAEMPCLKPLFSGPLNKCLAFSPDFVSTIPSLHSTSKSKVVTSKAEGVVVKNWMELKITDAKGGIVRAVAKNKSAKFSEVVASAAATKGREKDALCNYVTKARLSNVLSKCGKIKNRKEAKLMERLKNEVLDDIVEEAKAGDALLCAYLAKNEAEARTHLKPKVDALVQQWSTEK